MTAWMRPAVFVLVGVFALILLAIIYRRLGIKGKARLSLALFLVVAAGLSYYSFAIDPISKKINLGLDLRGGIHIVLEGVDSPEAPVTEESMKGAHRVIERRVDLLGVSEPYIQQAGKRIIIELPGVDDPDKAIDVIGRTAVLEFKDEEGQIILTGKDLKKADVGLRGSEPVVTLEFNAEGTKKFAEGTQANVGKIIAIVLDNQVISSPLVKEAILSGQAEITGYSEVQDAYNLSILLNSGALPVNLSVVENRSISATLGKDSIERSVRAGIVGISLIILFMLGYYRFPGVLADLALLIYVLILLAALVYIRATLTLPGIAGIILSVGMAVDANVIIFERIREELKTGRTIKSAVDSGFRRAFTTILDSNITTLIAAGVLFYLGTGPIRGFAVTLSIGILTSMFTAIVITRFLMITTINSELVKNRKLFFGI